MTVVVGTAGHIDHGKTTLLRALTGIDADRLPEEQRRGMTIDVGYAHLALPDGTELDFVDVPGHDKLVGNMLVGAGEIDAALLVVAADDGPRAQTLEHLEILDALGIVDGLAVITKADAVAPKRAQEVAAHVAALLARTTLDDSPVVVASATTGDGLDALREALLELRDRVLSRGAAAAHGSARLAVDRVFTVKGRGTVVTGSLRGGALERGATLRIVPGGGTVRARELQVHGRARAATEPGRVAINIAGSEVVGLARGSVLATGPSVIATDRLLVALRLPVRLDGTAIKLPPDRSRIQLHVGTARVAGVVGRGGRDAIELPDREIAAILRLEEPVAVAAGDRFVLRRPSPAETLAGGRILDADPPRGVSRRRTTPERVTALAAAEPNGPHWRAARLDLHGLIDGAPDELAPDVAAWLAGTIVELVNEHGTVPVAELRVAAGRALRRVVTVGPPLPIATVSASIERLVAEGRLARRGDRVADPARASEGPSPATVEAMARLERALDVPAPPPLADAARVAGCPAEGIRALEAAGRILRLDDDLAYAAPAYREIERRALALATAGPLTPAALRDATGTSRKYVMAILEDLDRRGVLRRTPAGHVPGPRAALEVGR